MLPRQTATCLLQHLICGSEERRVTKSLGWLAVLTENSGDNSHDDRLNPGQIFSFPISLSPCLHIVSYQYLIYIHQAFFFWILSTIFNPFQLLVKKSSLFQIPLMRVYKHLWFGGCFRRMHVVPSHTLLVRILEPCNAEVQEDGVQVVQICHEVDVPEKLIQQVMTQFEPQIPDSFYTITKPE